MKKYTLTEEHRVQLKPWADRWTANAMSTRPMTESDRTKCREAVKGLYEAAGLPQPKHIVFVSSPFVLRFAGGFAAAIWWLRKNKKTAATRDATYAATYAATDAATSDLSRWYVLKEKQSETAAKLRLGNFGLQCAINVWRMWSGGNHWSAWAGFLSFFRHVVKLPIDYSKWQHWETLTEHSGPRIMHPEFCMISDRPEVLLVDERNRPHCDTGPFCRWRDGSALYSVHGVRLPAWIIERKQDITIAKIDAEQNMEIRRVMIDMYRSGIADYILDSGAVATQEDDYGTLYRKEVTGDDPIVMVKVINSTPEPDMSFKTYWLRVSPELRPLLGNGKMGNPQKLTARNAVAASFGKYGEDYEPTIES